MIQPTPEIPPHQVMRRGKLLSGLDLATSRGVEIGALDSPTVRTSEGSIFYVDHVDTEGLKAKYKADATTTVANIVDVDAVWGTQTLRDCVGHDTVFDYVVASHVIEHVPDLITWFQEIASILKPGGTLRLAIPDRRYTFDAFRFETRIHDVLDAYLEKARVPRPRQIIDFFAHARPTNSYDAWAHPVDRTASFPLGGAETGLSLARDAIANGSYHDVHCWVFTPRSFAVLCREMAGLNLSRFALREYHETERDGLEFFATLALSDDPAPAVESWTPMLSATG